MGRRRRMKLRKGMYQAGGTGRPDAGTKDGPAGPASGGRQSGRPAGTLPQKRHISGNAGLAERFGMEGEPDLHKHDKLTNFVKGIKQAMDQKGFDKNRYISSLRASGIGEEAIGLAQGIIEVSADDKISRYTAILDTMNRGRYEEALEMIEEFERRYCVFGFTSRYSALMNLGRLKEALSLCDGVLDSEPTPYAVCCKSDILRELGRVQELVELHDRWEKEFPGDPDILADRARVLVSVGNLDEAEEMAEEALRLEEITIPAYLALGEALAARGDTAGAIKILNRALDIDENEDEVYARKAEILLDAGEHEKAALCCEQRLGVVPGIRRLREIRYRAEAAL